MHRIQRLSAIAMLLLLIGAGCNPRGYGNVTVEIGLSGAAEALSASVDHVVIRAVNGGLVKQSPSLSLTSGAASYSFTDLPAGVWSMEATGYDATNKGIYSGKANVVVSRDVASTAALAQAPGLGLFAVEAGNLAQIGVQSAGLGRHRRGVLAGSAQGVPAPPRLHQPRERLLEPAADADLGRVPAPRGDGQQRPVVLHAPAPRAGSPGPRRTPGARAIPPRSAATAPM